MLDIAPELAEWSRQGRTFAVATVVAVTGSAPRPPGAALAVDAGGEVIGTVSGGCVEGAVYELCRSALSSGVSGTHRFGYSDETAFAVGLTCGGVIDIFVQPVTAALAPAWEAVALGERVTVARIVDGPPELLGRNMVVIKGITTDSLGDPELDRSVLGARSTGLAQAVLCASGQRVGVLTEVSAPPPRMLIFGALDFAAALTTVGVFLGYRVTVCDARPVFATPQRFPGAEVVVDWPHRFLGSTGTDERTVICVLTHDPKFDIPVLRRALRMPVAYVGAMGSRRTHADRLDLLRAEGLTGSELARLHSPIGLDLGALTPAETALSIGAEIVAHLRSGSGHPLSAVSGPIHPRTPADNVDLAPVSPGGLAT